MSSDEEIIESELKGKTLLVYMHILKNPGDPELGFSSPSVSSYHLNKLQDLGLVENVYGDYQLLKDIKVGVLKQFIMLGGVMLPRYLFYAVLMTTMLLTFLVQTPYFPSREYVTTIMMGLVPSVILWYETIKIWRERPR